MILTNKKIMLLNFPILDVGGITSWAHQIIKGFQKIGFQADHYYCTRTGNFKCSEDEFSYIGKKFKRGEKIPSKTLGFCGDENIAYFKKLALEYDYVIFVHPSPHPTKANKAATGMEDWQRLYIECPIPRVVCFHDKKWHKTNQWFKEVVNDMEVVLCDQHNFIDSVEDYASHRTIDKKLVTDWLFFPLNVEECLLRKEEFFANERKQLCMMPQWIKWKNHNKILEVAQDIKMPIHFYNGGMEYHKLAKTEMFQDAFKIDWVEDEYSNKEALHEYHGFVTYEKVKEVYAKSLGSIDMTTRTYQNFVHHEGCLYGAITLCTEACREGPYNHIHDGEYWSVDLNDVAGSINRFIDLPENDKLEIRTKAFERTAKDFDCRNIAKKINDIVENLTI